MPCWGARGSTSVATPARPIGMGFMTWWSWTAVLSVQGTWSSHLAWPKSTCTGRTSRPSPFTMLLNILESPEWDLPECFARMVGGTASMDALTWSISTECVTRLPWVIVLDAWVTWPDHFAVEADVCGMRVLALAICNIARYFGTSVVGFA